MLKSNIDAWDKVERGHVENALKLYKDNPSIYPYSKARNTFLVVGGITYSAKCIRYIAGSIANGKEIENQHNGGLDTKTFFENLGFMIKYTGKKRFILTQ